jgi:hypothetical protein
VSPIRVLVFAMPRLLHDILDRLLTGAPEIAVLEGPLPGEDLMGAAVRANADVVIAAERSLARDAICGLLAARARTRLLAISHDGSGGVLYELRPHREAIGELSREAVLESIRPREC